MREDKASLAWRRVREAERERAKFGAVDSLAQGWLAECCRRIFEAIENGELNCGSIAPALELRRHGAPCSPSMIELALDYGEAGQAKVALWARPAALWQAHAPMSEKLRAWRGAWRLRCAQGWDQLCDEAMACAQILSSRVEPRMGDFSKYKPERSKQEQDQLDWQAWLDQARPALEDLREQLGEINSPEWEAGGVHAKALVQRISQASKKS